MSSLLHEVTWFDILKERIARYCSAVLSVVGREKVSNQLDVLDESLRIRLSHCMSTELISRQRDLDYFLEALRAKCRPKRLRKYVRSFPFFKRILAVFKLLSRNVYNESRTRRALRDILG